MSEPSSLISVSTFMKSDALRVVLESLLDYGYDKVAKVHIADDNGGASYTVTKEKNPHHPIWEFAEGDSVEMQSALEVYNDLKGQFANGLHISYGKGRGGISINKNRGIYYFLNKTQAPYLLLIDDDIRFVRSGMIEEWAQVLQDNADLVGANGKYTLNTLTGYWSDIAIDASKWEDKFEGGKSWAVTKAGWFDTFPLEAVGNKIEWRRGCMGVSNFYARKAVEEVQYYDLLPGKYGYEHSLHTSRVLLKVDRRSPQLFPIYDWSERYFVGQAVPNNYSGTVEEAQKSDPKYQELMNGFAFGLNLKNEKHGLNLKEETII